MQHGQHSDTPIRVCTSLQREQDARTYTWRCVIKYRSTLTLSLGMTRKRAWYMLRRWGSSGSSVTTAEVWAWRYDPTGMCGRTSFKGDNVLQHRGLKGRNEGSPTCACQEVANQSDWDDWGGGITQHLLDGTGDVLLAGLEQQLLLLGC
jgi:hypothetical protein